MLLKGGGDQNYWESRGQGTTLILKSRIMTEVELKKVIVTISRLHYEYVF